MKKLKFLFLIVLTIVILAGCSTSRPEKIGLLDMETVLQNSERAQYLQNELLDIGNELEIQYQKKEEELSGEEDNQELDRIYQEYMDNKQRLETSLNNELNEIITEVSEEEELGIVLYNETVYFGGTDITEKVINRLDEKYNGGGDTNNG